MTEKTLVLIKPDAVPMNICGKILSEYEQRGLKILLMATVVPSAELVRAHYDEHKHTPTFEDLVASMANKTVKMIIIEGPGAIARVRSINGATDPIKANPETIRAKYGASMRCNCVHASDSVSSAEREIKLWVDLNNLIIV